MPYRIRIIGGGWVREYDPDGGNPRVAYPTGLLTETQDPARALVFPTLEAAWKTWQAQSRRTPRRPDGKPNRPMTAYTVEIEPVPPEEEPR